MAAPAPGFFLAAPAPGFFYKAAPTPRGKKNGSGSPVPSPGISSRDQSNQELLFLINWPLMVLTSDIVLRFTILAVIKGVMTIAPTIMGYVYIKFCLNSETRQILIYTEHE